MTSSTIDIPSPSRPAPGRHDAGLTVSQVAEESGVSASAIRFYEKHGLITATRTPANQRRFGTDAGCRVKVARVAQRIGLTVAQIAGILDTLPTDPGLEDWQRLHAVLVEEAERRIADLRRALDAVTSGSRLCEIDL